MTTLIPALAFGDMNLKARTDNPAEIESLTRNPLPQLANPNCVIELASSSAAHDLVAAGYVNDIIYTSIRLSTTTGAPNVIRFDLAFTSSKEAFSPRPNWNAAWKYLAADCALK